MSKGTSVYICADGTLTYGPYGGRDKIVPQALPIAVVTDENEAEDLITLVGRRAYDVPEADPRFGPHLVAESDVDTIRYNDPSAPRYIHRAGDWDSRSAWQPYSARG